MKNDELLLIVLRAIKTVGLDTFKSTSMFTNIRAKRKSRAEKKAA